MTLIRKVLVDRQLSYEQAHVLVGQREIADILGEQTSISDETAFVEAGEEQQLDQKSEASYR